MKAHFRGAEKGMGKTGIYSSDRGVRERRDGEREYAGVFGDFPN
jgi:hypothetical protein